MNVAYLIIISELYAEHKHFDKISFRKRLNVCPNSLLGYLL